jgi:uncharacterized RDD family membrane protein YckC
MATPREREIGRGAAIQRAEPQHARRVEPAPAPAAAPAQQLVELAPIAFPFTDETLYLHAIEYEDRITIPTPEGVSLELTLAGLGSRMVAGMIDMVLKVLLVACVVLVLIEALGVEAALAIVPIAVLAIVFYDIAFETLASGRTPGKRMSGLRVVRTSGRPVDATASAIRNVVRLVDGVALSYVPTIVSILATKRNQRPGDLAADTVVIRDRREIDRVLAPDALAAPVGDPFGTGARWDVSAVGVDDVATVRAFLERRFALPAATRARLAGQLDAGLRPLVGGADERDPERFLEIVYEAKRTSG